MKFLIITLLVAVVSTTLKAEELDRIAQVEAECMKEKNVPEDLIKKAKAGDFTEADANKQNCFAECAFYKLNFLKPGSMEINVEAIKNVCEERGGEHYKSIVEKCLKQEANNACDLTYKIYKCFYQEKAQHAIMSISETPAPLIAPDSMLRALVNAQMQQPAQQGQQAQQDQTKVNF